MEELEKGRQKEYNRELDKQLRKWCMDSCALSLRVERSRK